MGKTTLAANLGAILSKQHQRVLLVDLDYQGTLTSLCLPPGEIREIRRREQFVDRLFLEPSVGPDKLAQYCHRVWQLAGVRLIAADEPLADAENKVKPGSPNMNVKELQQFLQSLGTPLSVSGAKKVADDLGRVCAGLEPFQDLSIAQFAQFLVRADSYARTGVVPTTGRPKRAGTRSAAKTANPEAIRAATEHVRSLYERATSPEVDYSTIDAEIKKLERGFHKDAVLEIARGFGISGSLKTKRAALEEIQRRMTERKESFERTQF